MGEPGDICEPFYLVEGILLICWWLNDSRVMHDL